MQSPGLFTLIGVTAVALCWVFAVVLFRVGQAGSVARLLAWVLVVEGIALVTNVVYYFLEPDSAWVAVCFILHTLGDCAMLALYPLFLAAALNTKLTLPLSGRRSKFMAFGYAIGLFLVVMLTPLKVGATMLYASLSLCFTYALVASIHAWWVAKRGIARDRARTFAIAFGIRDVCWSFVYFMAAMNVLTDQSLSPETTLVVDYFYRTSTLLYVPIIAYGILRSHLFDIDLRIRWTIKQSTVAAIFVAVMFVISEGASEVLSDELGTVTGLLAAGVLMFFLAPLQRFADRVAGAAMPNTENTPEYKAFRKMQVYETAVSEALQEGGISEKERNLLGHLRESLGISEADAAAIEGELQGAA